ncbi:hypothetical protein ACJU26_09725 [Acidithiobacillus sp. M4-SHS-6]|uniref:hypothetical protein n=1 Tax=Acidithiobacillus sp. M4-SHS-6 TaxID=3383024 RepID=UPI0039BE7C4F
MMMDIPVSFMDILDNFGLEKTLAWCGIADVADDVWRNLALEFLYIVPDLGVMGSYILSRVSSGEQAKTSGMFLDNLLSGKSAYLDIPATASERLALWWCFHQPAETDDTGSHYLVQVIYWTAKVSVEMAERELEHADMPSEMKSRRRNQIIDRALEHVYDEAFRLFRECIETH